MELQTAVACLPRAITLKSCSARFQPFLLSPQGAPSTASCPQHDKS
jgi:hypothetical protein